ncbi:MAG: hypothetical protein IK083_05965 [Abditibacteriota bacterium]|nr:hypothetical protein [Abditibacteriota bacterium]MBR4749099.1 hypothetical protein [Abditibacteriota bacterium]
MLKLRSAGLNIALDLLHRDFFRERFEEFCRDFDGRPDFCCVSHLVKEIPVPEGSAVKTSPTRTVFYSPGLVTVLGCDKSGGRVFAWSLTDDASEMHLYFLEDHTYRLLTRTGMEYGHSFLGFADRLVLAGMLALHGAAISYKGRGIIFCARPGVGKSTQAALWKDLWPEETVRINEDRPVLSFEDGGATLRGIPWSGSVPINLNTSVPFGALVLIRRGTAPGIERLKPAGVFRPIYRELCVSHVNRQAAEKVYDLLGLLLERTPVYMLDCTMDIQTPLLLREALAKDGII